MFEKQHLEYFNRIHKMQLRNPRMIGFGISNKATADAARQYASGIIIGSKFISILDQEKDPMKAVEILLQTLSE